MGESARTQHYVITKFDVDLNPTGDVYDLNDYGSNVGCTCPASHRPICRHRSMLQTFKANQAIDKHIFFDYDNQRWYDPSASMFGEHSDPEKAS